MKILPKFKKTLKYLSIIITFVLGVILIVSTYIFILEGSISLPLGSSTKITFKGVSLFPLSLKHLEIVLPNYGTEILASNITAKENRVNLSILEVKLNFPLSRKTNESNISSSPFNWKKYLDWLKFFNVDELVVKNTSVYIRKNNDSHLSIGGLRFNLNPSKEEITITGDNFEVQYKFGGKVVNFFGSLLAYITAPEGAPSIEVVKCEFGDNKLKGAITFTKNLHPANIKIQELTLTEPFLENFKAFVNHPFTAQRILLKDIEIEFDENKGYSITYTRGKVEVNSLLWGMQDMPLIIANPSIQWTSEILTSPDGIKVNGNISLEGINTEIYIFIRENSSYEIGTKGDLNLKTLRKTSPYLFNYFPHLKLEDKTLKINSNWKVEANKLQGDVTIESHYNKDIIISSTINSDLTTIYTTPEVVCNVDAKLQKSSANLQLQVNGRNIKGYFRSEKIILCDLIGLYSTLPVSDPLDSVCTKVEASFQGEFPSKFNLLLNAENYIQSDEDIQPLAPAKWNIRGTLLDMSSFLGDINFISENSLSLSLPNFKAYLFPLKISSPISAQVYLSNIDSKVINIPFVGVIKLGGDLNWSVNDPLTLNFNLSGEGLGYPPYIFPDSMYVVSRGIVKYNPNLSRVYIPQIELGVNDYYPILVKEAYFELPDNFPGESPNLKASSLIFDIDGDTLVRSKILKNSAGRISGEFTDLELINGEITFNKYYGKLENVYLELPYFNMKLENLNGETKNNNANRDINYELTADKVSIYGSTFYSPKVNLNFSILPFYIHLNEGSSILWNGKINAKASVSPAGLSKIAKLTAEVKNIDLTRFTEEVQPPWVRLVGRGDATLELLFDLTKMELMNLDFSIVCENGVSINRDVLLKLIMYLQNIRIVEKRLEKLLGPDDPKKFNYGELNIGYKNEKATISILLSTKDLELAPVFYINANWSQIWSLLKAPSNVQIEIK